MRNRKDKLDDVKVSLDFVDSAKKGVFLFS